MKELIKVTTNQNGEKTTGAKELYLGLGLNKGEWSRWYSTNIESNEFFMENEDWVGFVVTTKGNKTMDFTISLEFAKHIAMMARTEKSHEYRNYFIDCEKQLQEVKAVMDTKSEMSLADWNKIRFSIGRTKNTFADSNVDEIKQLVNEFIDYAIDLDTQIRVVRCDSAVKGLQELHDRVAKESTLNIAECYKILQYKDGIKDVKHMAENRRNGQLKAHKNRKIKKLELSI